MAYINLYLHNPHQASANIDASVKADTDARCGQDFNLLVSTSKRKKKDRSSLFPWVYFPAFRL